MADGAELRGQARRLRDAARAMREKAAPLGDGLETVQQRYVLGPGGVWEGPYADRFTDGVTEARGTLSSLVYDVATYAGACERRAARLEADADAADLAAAAD